RLKGDEELVRRGREVRTECDREVIIRPWIRRGNDIEARIDRIHLSVDMNDDRTRIGVVYPSNLIGIPTRESRLELRDWDYDHIVGAERIVRCPHRVVRI